MFGGTLDVAEHARYGALDVAYEENYKLHVVLNDRWNKVY